MLQSSCDREPGTDFLVECPYNRSHQILNSRFPNHLIKCRETSDNTNMKQCRFNSSHMVREMEINYHEIVCLDRKSFDTYKYTVATSSYQTVDPTDEPASTYQPVASSESWDDCNAPSYDPEKYVSSASVIRLKVGGPPSTKKEFRRAERKRLGELE